MFDLTEAILIITAASFTRVDQLNEMIYLNTA